MSITYMNLTGDNVAPYKVNHFTWSASTNEVTANITISSSYIGAETDLTSELELDQEDKINRWSWEHTLYNLANEDVTKIKDVLELNLVFAFNMLGMKKELEI